MHPKCFEIVEAVPSSPQLAGGDLSADPFRFHAVAPLSLVFCRMPPPLMYPYSWLRPSPPPVHLS